MDQKQNYNKNDLLNSLVVKKIEFVKAKKIIDSYDNPIPIFIAKGIVIKKNFYPNLAKLFKLSYRENLPTLLNSEKSIAQIIPYKLLISANCFLFDENGQIFLAVSDPFIDRKIIEEILSYTTYSSATLVIVPPQEILRSLNQTYYNQLAIITEDLIHVLHPLVSTKTYKTLVVPNIFPIASLIIWTVCMIFFTHFTILATYLLLNTIYFLINPVKIYTFIKSFSGLRQLIITAKEIKTIDENKLPVYTLLIPLKDEKEMVPNLIKNIYNLDYPKDRLDIKFLVETNDQETIQALHNKGIGVNTPDAEVSGINSQLLLIPPGLISTKPRKCDYALAFSKGKYTVIYDAEDLPDPNQLKKAYLGFNKVKLDTVCLQAKLNFYNSKQNLLTRFFSLEYGFWYEYYLPGLQEVSSPIPLGGTSNHFATNYLKTVGTWDPYNVTEDADLGLRIFRYKYETAMLNSYTLEEANSKVGNWIRQRTRWQKGFLLTFLVHISHPIFMVKQLGLKKFLLSMITFGGSFFLPFFNPVMWLIFLFSFIHGWGIFHIQEPNRLYTYIAVFNLWVGNLTYIVLHAFSAYKNKRYDLIPLSLLLPFYWILISIATIRAGIQFIQNPFYWKKTKHGLMEK